MAFLHDMVFCVLKSTIDYIYQYVLICMENQITNVFWVQIEIIFHVTV